MPNYGIKHIDVGGQLTKAEWEATDTHDIDFILIPDGAGHYLQVPKLTTAQRDALTPVNGMIIYNSTTGRFEAYQAGAWGALGITDHGGLGGLADDDHAQYLKEKASGGTAAETPAHVHQAAATCGKLDHGAALNGLGDDDHTIYVLRNILTAQGDIFTRDATVIKKLIRGAADTILRMGASEPAWSALADFIDKSHLSQDFGASSARLVNLILSPISGYALLITTCGADTPFTASINGNPTATSVVYDGDANENFFNGLAAYDGATYWGQIVLHNTTRGNSRNIVSVNRGTNTITTTDTTDDWADDDALTTQSQTNAEAGYIDLLLDDNIAATDIGVFMTVIVANNDVSARVLIHPYEAYDTGKKQAVFSNINLERSEVPIPLTIVSQLLTIDVASNANSIIALKIIGTFEYADT